MNPVAVKQAGTARKSARSLVLAGLLGLFVSASYVSVIRRVGSDDIEQEFERELFEEYEKQEKQEKKNVGGKAWWGSSPKK